MRAVLAVIAILLVACTNTSAPAARFSPTSTASASPLPGGGASPSAVPTPASQGAPVGTPSSLGLSLSCRLPVTWTVKNGEILTAKAGFMTFPEASIAEDSSAPGGSRFYDRALSKWLPAFRAAVSPDGRRYAYSVIAGNAYQNTGSQLHVVDVATAADRVIYNGKAALNVVDFEAEGVYVTAAVPEGRPRGLWLQDLTGSPLRLISSTIVAPAVGGGSAWGVDFNTADPSPGPGGLEGPMNRILRYDFSGASTPWFYRPGANIYLMGFDANGHPFVSAGFESNGQATQEVWLIASSGNA